ncbi:MAG: hypothetical protein RLZZ387_333 [Chloroflexota bacterium]
MFYQHALADRVRLLSLAGLTPTQTTRVSLATTYVDRPLAHADTTAEDLPTVAVHRPTLAALARAPRTRLLIRAPLGSGKTTTLRRLALAYAASASGELDPAASLAGDWLDPIPLPILLDLAGQAALPSDPDDLIAAALHRQELASYTPEIMRSLEEGACLVLVDGVDSLASVASVEALAERYPANRYIVAALPESATPLSFTPYLLPPLDRGQIDEFVARWYAALAPDAPDLQDRIARLQGRLLPNEPLLDVVALPLALVMCVLADAGGRSLPQARAGLYPQLIDLLLDRWGNEAPLGVALGLPALSSAEVRLALLQPLALRLQELAAAPASVSLSQGEAIELLLESLSPLGGEVRHTEELAARCLRASLLAPSGPGTLTMPHGALRSYLAARALAAAPAKLTALAHHSTSTAWHEALALAVRLRDTREPGSSAAVIGPLVRNKPQSAQPQRPSLLLGATLLQELDPDARPQDLTAATRCELLDLLGAQHSPLPERVRAGLLLGQLGDPRFNELLPPMAYVEGGSFLLGARVAGFEDEGPQQRIDVPAFRIGVYPVTNHEYARFLEANPDRARPHYWHDPRFNNPSLPVVGVTWDDAVAFCAWLTTEASRAGMIPQGTVVRLPLEAEWEKAATWGPGARRKQVFPWGDAWDAGRANTANGRQSWLTTPVGCYPAGVSRYGIHDMTGNVWEWTASEYTSYPGSALPQHQVGHYVLRGSSCVSLATNARATYRGSHLPPHYWRYHLGFRVVVGRPLAHPH